jgi:hypothetical protein
LRSPSIFSDFFSVIGLCYYVLSFLRLSPGTIIAMPDISSVANCFAVVGLADVLIRLSVHASGIYERYRTSSEGAASLLEQLKALVSIVAEVGVYADAYKNKVTALTYQNSAKVYLRESS